MTRRVAIPDSGNAVLYGQLCYSIWEWLYPDTDFTSTVRGLSTPTPPQAKRRSGSPGKLRSPRVGKGGCRSEQRGMVAYLLEVGCEELPASFVDSALEQWRTGIPASLAEAHLQAEQMQLFGTPRRLAVLLQGLPTQQPDRVLEVKGPPAQVAYQDGRLTPAGEKFAQKQGVDPGSLEIRQVGKGSFVFAVQRVRGRPTAAVLQELAPGWITNLSGERLMRWACGDLKFPRPIRWLVSLWDDQVLPLLLPTHEGNSMSGLVAGRVSRGHRVLGSQRLVLERAESYVQQMQAAGVSPDPAARAAHIRAEVAKLARQVQGEAQIPPSLLQEVVQLVEWPTAVLGRFEPEFLRLPVAVIETVMITHQRYFPVRDGRDPEKLLPYFITISNGDPEQSERIAAGNSRCLLYTSPSPRDS